MADHVVHINETTYDQFIQDNNNAFVVFVKAKCKACKYGRPKLKKLAYEAHTKNWDVKIAVIDGILNPSLAEKYKIQKDQYPSSFFLNKKENTTSEFLGDLSFKGLYSYLNYRLNFNVKEINSLEEIPPLMKKKYHCVLFLGDKNTHSTQFNTITKNYDELRPYLVLQSNNPEIMSKFGLSQNEYDVVLFNKLKATKDDKKSPKKDRPVRVNEGVRLNLVSSRPLTKESFLDNLHSYMRPLIGELEEETLNRIFEEKITTVIIIAQNDKEVKIVVEKVAAKHRPHIWFLVSKLKNDENEPFMNLMKINKKELPAMVLFDHQKNIIDDMVKYKWVSKNQKIEEQDIEEFLTNWKNQKLQRFLISEVPPKKSADKKTNVHTIVSDTFLQYVGNVTNDVLVLFCSHYSRRCGRLETVYEAVALKLKNNTNLVIAEIDPLANELENVHLIELPHLVLYPGEMSLGDRLKNLVVYSGNYTISDIVSFVEKNAKNTVTVSTFKKEEKYTKLATKKPVIKEGEEIFNINDYTKYGKQRFIGEFEGEEENMFDDDEEMDQEKPRKKQKPHTEL